MTLATSGRGCGSWKSDALYHTWEVSPVGGIPVYNLIVCPQWVINPQAMGIKPRGITILPRLDNQGNKVMVNGQVVHDIWDWVGSQYYPYKISYYSEVNKMGFSRRIPRNAQLDKLIPGYSMHFLIHSKGALTPSSIQDLMNAMNPDVYSALRCMAHLKHDQTFTYGGEPCSMLWRDEIHKKDVTTEFGQDYLVHPSFRIPVRSYDLDLRWNPAVFMALPVKYSTFYATTPRGSSNLSDQLKQVQEMLKNKGFKVNTFVSNPTVDDEEKEDE